MVVNGGVTAAVQDDIMMWFSKCGEIERSTTPSRLDSAADSPLHSLSSIVLRFGEPGAVANALTLRSKKIAPVLIQTSLDAYR